MAEPRITRPHFPEGYMADPKATVDWGMTVEKLCDAKNYWVCTADKDGKPHAVPVWAAWVEGRIYFDGSAKTRYARNIKHQPYVVVHLENGSDVVIVEGIAEHVKGLPKSITSKISEQYKRKYAGDGYTPEPDQWDESGLFSVRPVKALAWTEFSFDPTKFEFPEE